MTVEIINKIEGIEASIKAFQEKAQEEIKAAGSVANETKNALEKMGEKQHEIAERLLNLEQSGINAGSPSTAQTVGNQFVENDGFKAYIGGQAQKVSVEVQNAALVGSDATVAPDRSGAIIGGAFQPLTLEAFLNSIPTTSNAIEYTRESAFVNNAAEVAEGAASAETSPAFALATMPVSNVSHHTLITKQLASDSPALAAYINTRMMYGVNLRVEQQLANGNGTAPNISGLLAAGNFTAHGYTAAMLGTVLPRHVLLRRMIADAWSTGYPADAIVLNPTDFALLEIEELTSNAGQKKLDTDAAGVTREYGLPIIQSIGVPAGQVIVGAFGQSATVHNRQGVMIEMSDSHGTNFTSDIITIKASRRLALTVERPAGIIAGSLTPA